MGRRSFAILAVVTLVVVILAAVSVLDMSRRPATLAEGLPAFPALQGHVNDVTEIVVVNRSDTTRIQRTETGWVLPDKHGYPAQTDKVRELIVGLEDLKLIEAKTSQKDRYERLDVNDPTGKESNAAHVTLKSKDGKVLADAIIGRRKYDLSSSGVAGTYLRKPDEAQAWLARGEVDPGKDERMWLARKILDVKKDRVRRYDLVHGDGETVTAVRDSAKQDHFRLATRPEGAALKSDGAADSVASTLAFLEFDDVRPAAAVNFPEPKVKATFATFDGLVVDVAVAEIDGAHWARFAARQGEAVAAAAAEKVEAPKDAPEATKPEGQAASPAKGDPPLAEQVGQINATAGEWVYKLPEYAARNLTSRNAGFLAEKKPGA